MPTVTTRKIASTLIVLCLTALAAILVAARVHGFSFAMWHTAIDGSPHCEVFLHDAKGYRSDDWLVALPYNLSQRADTPAFSTANRMIGDGHYNMLITCAAPVRDPIVLFRPQVWGYFISGDVGMAFQWWFNAIGAWIAFWLVLRRLTGNDSWTSVWGATALLFSPFFQAWSLNCAPSLIFACGLLLALDRLWMAPSIRHSLPAALILTWCGGALLLTFNYLPYMITLFYLVLFVFMGMAMARRKLVAPPGGAAWRWALTLLAVLGILGLGGYLVAGNWEIINIIRQSDYPGQRLSAGGDQTIWHLFRGNILSIKPPGAWRDFNPCEGAAFFMVFPLVAAALLRDWWQKRHVPAIPLLAIGGYIIFLLIWNLTGFPETLAKWTLMNRAPPFRTLIGLGIADLLFLAVFVSTRRQPNPEARADRITPWIVGALWIGFHVALGLKLSRYFPDYSLSTALFGGLFSMALAPLLYLAPRLVMPAIMIASILTTYDINPLARGGSGFIQDNPLSQKIIALDQEALNQGRQPVWIAYGDLALPNLFRMIGSRAINGVHAYPQFGLWKTLDPEGRYKPVYNRYAHVVFDLPATADDFDIRLVQPDLFVVFLHPDDPRFDALNVQYIIGLDHQAETFDRITKLTKIYSYSGKHIYRVNRTMSDAK